MRNSGCGKMRGGTDSDDGPEDLLDQGDGLGVFAQDDGGLDKVPL